MGGGAFFYKSTCSQVVEHKGRKVRVGREVFSWPLEKQEAVMYRVSVVSAILGCSKASRWKDVPPNPPLVGYKVRLHSWNNTWKQRHTKWSLLERAIRRIKNPKVLSSKGSVIKEIERKLYLRQYQWYLWQADTVATGILSHRFLSLQTTRH